ncbi:MAG: peptide chain release factor N(5)-glutamine methyltransferase [Armatimonadetes bacterium]|nr:peptide chain release factor N(5)-glutamine methyltransferase [Armatimonadota bacterium]
MNIGEWIRCAPVEWLDAEAIAAHSLGVTRSQVLAHPEWDAPELALEMLLQKRLTGMPLAYVTGRKEFYGRDFVVNPSVLIPRPETEVLVEAVLPLLAPGMLCVDIGTGSGVIAITLALESPETCWIATDVSGAALRIAAQNAHALASPIKFIRADRLEALAARSVDLIVSNPPYVTPGDVRLQAEVERFEPHIALFAKNGTSFIRELVHDARRVLRPHGIVAFEFGAGQSGEVREILCDLHHKVVPDLAGVDRVAIARL